MEAKARTTARAALESDLGVRSAYHTQEINSQHGESSLLLMYPWKRGLSRVYREDSGDVRLYFMV